MLINRSIPYSSMFYYDLVRYIGSSAEAYKSFRQAFLGSSRFSPTKVSISSFSIFISDFLDLFTSFIHLASYLSRMEIKDEGSNAISFIRTLLNNTISVVTYKDMMNRKNQSELFASLKSA